MLVAWGGSYFTFSESVSEGAYTVATAALDRIDFSLQFALLGALDIAAVIMAADFGGLVDCGATSLEQQLDLAQHATIQFQTFETVHLLAVLTPAAVCDANDSGLEAASSGALVSCAAAVVAASGSAPAACNDPTFGSLVSSFCPKICGLCTALVLVGDAQLGVVPISPARVYIGDPATDTLTAFPLLANRSVDRTHPELILSEGLGRWIAEMRKARGWRASLAEGGWKWGDLVVTESGEVTQPLLQSV